MDAGHPFSIHATVPQFCAAKAGKNTLDAAGAHKEGGFSRSVGELFVRFTEQFGPANQRWRLRVTVSAKTFFLPGVTFIMVSGFFPETGLVVR